MKKFLLLSFVLFLAKSTFAQKEYNPMFLIPYNDHGKWGWCDTSGTIVVKQEFEETNFFNGFGDHFLADIIQNGHRANYVLDLGVTGPATYHSFMVYDEEFFDLKCSILLDDQYNMGLYSIEKKKVLISPEFHDDYQILNATNQIFVFRNKENKVGVYDFKTGKTLLTQYKSFQKDEEQNEIYFLDVSENAYYLNDKMQFVKYKEQLEPASDDRYGVAEYEKPAKAFEQIPYFNMIVNLPDSVKPHSGINRGFNKELYVCFKNGNFGVLDKKNKTYIPFEYDFISIDYTKALIYLIKDGKIGVKLLNTTYPQIEPKYDYLVDYKVFEVSEKWGFWIFDAELNGQRVYVGENGKEYYNFK